jgi:hypothetical protein
MVDAEEEIKALKKRIDFFEEQARNGNKSA